MALWIWATQDLDLLGVVLYSPDVTTSISALIEQFVMWNKGLLLQELQFGPCHKSIGSLPHPS